MKNNFPTVSVIIPTFDEEENIKSCLDSIFRQSYPKDKIEVVVVDDKSTDGTLKIVRKYPTRIFTSGARHGEISKMVGFKKASGEFAIYLDADVELVGANWFQKMLKPLLEDKEIVGSFTRKYSKTSDPPLERFLSFDPLQRDSLYQYFSPSIDETIIESRGGYFICRYKEGKIPPAGRCLYRRKKLLELVSNYEMFLELDFLVLLTRRGYNKFAYVPDACLYHHHAPTLHELLRKRRYNLKKVYLAREAHLYKWFDLSKFGDLLKIIFWIVYVNSVLPSFLVGVFKSIKHRDWAGMYEPLVNLLVTDLLLFEFLKDPKGRKLLLNT